MVILPHEESLLNQVRDIMQRAKHLNGHGNCEITISIRDNQIKVAENIIGSKIHIEST